MELSEKHDKLSSWTGWARLYCLKISGISCEVYFNEVSQQNSHFLLREVNLSSVNRDASLLMTVYCNCFETAWQNQDPSLLNCVRKLFKKAFSSVFYTQPFNSVYLGSRKSLLQGFIIPDIIMPFPILPPKPLWCQNNGKWAGGLCVTCGAFD